MSDLKAVYSGKVLLSRKDSGYVARTLLGRIQDYSGLLCAARYREQHFMRTKQTGCQKNSSM